MKDKRKAFEIYQAALDREDAERAAFIEAAAGGDAELLEAVRALLESAEKAER